MGSDTRNRRLLKKFGIHHPNLYYVCGMIVV